MESNENIEIEDIKIKKRVVCILGFHRSGTSAIARVVNLLGVDLGDPKILEGKSSDNLRGHWEHPSLRCISDELLARAGGSWRSMPCYIPVAPDLEKQVLNIVKKDFSKSSIWGWKDPRVCVTLPFWQKVLNPDLYIICVRNPLDIARSLDNFHGFSVGDASTFWLACMESVLNSTYDKTRMLICYEDLISNTDASIQRLADFLDLPVIESTTIHIKDFLTPSLYHYRSNTQEFLDHTDIPDQAKKLYLALLDDSYRT